MGHTPVPSQRPVRPRPGPLTSPGAHPHPLRGAWPSLQRGQCVRSERGRSVNTVTPGRERRCVSGRPVRPPRTHGPPGRGDGGRAGRTLCGASVHSPRTVPLVSALIPRDRGRACGVSLPRLGSIGGCPGDYESTTDHGPRTAPARQIPPKEWCVGCRTHRKFGAITVAPAERRFAPVWGPLRHSRIGRERAAVSRRAAAPRAPASDRRRGPRAGRRRAARPVR